MKKIVVLTAVLLLLVFSMGSSIADTYGQNGTSDIVSEVTGETAPPVPPIADADGPYSCYVHETILLDGSGSYDPDGTIIKYEWSFGDETTGTGVKPSHTYSLTGTFTVTLTVTDNHDLTDDDTTTVEVTSRPQPPPSPPPLPPPNKNPKSDAGPNQKVWVNRTILFSGAGSYDEDGLIISYNWDFSDGRMALGVDVSHVYSEPGHHTVTLTVKDDRYGEDSDTCIVKVYEVPAPIVGELYELVPAGKKGHVVNASKEANTTITLNTTSRVTVTVLKYECNPYPEYPINATTVPLYADVMVSITEAVEWPIYLEMEYTDDEVEVLNESSLGIYYWFNGTWQRCSHTGVDTERNLVWAYMTAEEASGSPILIGGITLPKPAEFEFTDIVITPEEVEPGDEVTISVLVTNIGEETGDYTVTLGMENGLIAFMSEAEVTLEVGESKTVPFTFTMNNEGIYTVTVDGLTGSFTVNAHPRPTEFFISELEAVGRQALVHDDEGRPIVEGEYVIFNVLVENIGEMEGTYTVEFKVRRLDRQTLWDEEMIDTLNVTLLAGRGRRAFTYYEALNVGTYQVSVGDLTDTFTVRAPLEPAEFVFSNLEITPRVKIGMSVNISVDVANVGEMMGFCTFDLKVNGRVVDSVEIPSFVGGLTATQFFELTRGEGTYEVEVGGLTGSFTVFISEPPFWNSPEFVMGMIMIIIGIVAIYLWRRGGFEDLKHIPLFHLFKPRHVAVEAGSALPLRGSKMLKAGKIAQTR